MSFLAAAAMLAAPSVPVCGYQVVRAFPHDANSFTQGLLFHEGQLYEGTGSYGQSRVARLNLATGAVLAQARYPDSQFGEGIARWGDQLISVTWRNGVGHRWRMRDLKPLGTFPVSGEGWGLATFGRQLVLSDGSSRLRFLDPATMRETKALEVTLRGQPLRMINELEVIDGQIWANVWMTNQIVRIDPASGRVASIVDLTGLRERAGAEGYDSVLNGIAYDAKAKRLFVTGKLWPKLFEIRVSSCR